MLRSMKDLISLYKLQATDGEIGKVKDFYFDDLLWIIKYLVADTAGWLSERLVLISPAALGEPDWVGRRLPVNLTREKIENSPPVDKEKPVSRQRESELIGYYAWPVNYAYGVDATHFAEMRLMAERMKQAEEERKGRRETSQFETHLRSVEEVMDYNIQATDDSIGHVEDFIFEDDTWIIRYMVIDTRNWLPGKKVLVSPEWINRVDWAKKKVFVNMDRESVKNSPEYNPSEPVNRAYEMQLYDYYGRPVYWGR